MLLAIIGGTRLSSLTGMHSTHRQVLRTPWGEPSSAAVFGELAGKEVVFLARHGHGHTIPPHKINYRANISALHGLQVDAILAVASVGAIAAPLLPGSLAVPHQIIDYTSDRMDTFFDGNDQIVRHIDFTHPYDAGLRKLLIDSAHSLQLPVIDHGVYAATSGPRLETAAEINRLERDGASMVGMTGMPEAVLARELGIPYATLAVVANWAAGRGDAVHAVPLSALDQVLAPAMQQAQKLLAEAVAHYG